MAKVTMPQLGESVAEGTIGKWLKQPGDTVEKYEPLLEVITDKVNAEVPSPFAGVLKEILVEEGATVPNNAEIAIIETADESNGTSAAEGGGARRAPPRSRRRPPNRRTAQPAQTSARPPPRPRPRREPRPRPTAPAAPRRRAAPAPRRATAPTAASRSSRRTRPPSRTDAPGNPDARMTPAVRRLLREHGLTAAQIVGTGGGGRITRDDVTNYVESQRTGQPVGGQVGRRRRGPAATGCGARRGAGGSGARRRHRSRASRPRAVRPGPGREWPRPAARRSRSPTAPTSSSCR